MQMDHKGSIFKRELEKMVKARFIFNSGHYFNIQVIFSSSSCVGELGEVYKGCWKINQPFLRTSTFPAPDQAFDDTGLYSLESEGDLIETY